MDRKIRTFLTLFVTITIALSTLCSCQSKKREKTADEVVISVTKDFCDAILDGDVDTVSDLANDDFDDESCSKVLKYYYNNPSWDEAHKKIADIILDSLTYRVDTNSVLASYEKETGTIDVYFSYVDYVKCFEANDNNDLVNYSNQLEVCKDTAFTKVTLDYVYVDDEWLLEDYEKAFIDLFSWKEFEFNHLVNYNDSITKFEIDGEGLIYDDSEGAYVNVSDFNITIEVSDNNGNWLGCYCYLYQDNIPIAYGDVGFDFLDFATYYSPFEAEFDIGANVFPAGNYKVVMFDHAGGRIAETEFKFIVSDDVAISTSGNSTGSNNSSSSEEFVFGDSDFVDKIVYINWWSRYNGVSFELDFATFEDIDNQMLYFKIGDINKNFIYESQIDSYSTNMGFVELYALVDVDIDDSYYLYVYDDSDNLVVRAKMYK